MSGGAMREGSGMDDARALMDLARRVRYHGSVERALCDMNSEDQDRLRRASEAILAHPVPTGCS